MNTKLAWLYKASQRGETWTISPGYLTLRMFSKLTLVNNSKSFKLLMFYADFNILNWSWRDTWAWEELVWYWILTEDQQDRHFWWQ